jgi:hypothetical protein
MWGALGKKDDADARVPASMPRVTAPLPIPIADHEAELMSWPAVGKQLGDRDNA